MDSPTPDFSNLPIAELHALCATTAASYREAHQFARSGNEESGKALVWLSGLMGAGIFSVQGLLAPEPLWIRLMAFVPWTLGILLAMVARLLLGELQLRNDLQHFGRLSLLGLLQIRTDRQMIATNLTAISAGSLESEAEKTALSRWLLATKAAFYCVHALFAIGVVATVIAIVIVERYH